MWLSRGLLARLCIWIVLFAGVFLGGCGFQAVSRSGVTAPLRLAETYVLPIAEREGQILRKELVYRFNPRGEPNDPRYLLEVTLRLSPKSLGARPNGDATYALMRANVSYTLSVAKNKQVLDKQSFEETAQYAIPDADFVSTYAEDAAKQRALEAAATTLEHRLRIFFEHQAQGRAILDEAL